MNLTLALSILALRLPLAATLLLLAAVAVHAMVRVPCASLDTLVCAGGVWALPDAGCTDLRLGGRVRISALWVAFELGPDRREQVLFRDQLSSGQWWRLLLVLRAGRGGRS